MLASSAVPGGLALIFDIDGVIVDSNPVHVEAWRKYLEGLGIEPGDNFPERMYGMRNDAIVRDLIGDDLSAEEVKAHGAAKEALYRQRMRPQLARRLVPGIVQFIRRHEGWTMGVASNAEPANVEFVLAGSGLAGYFSAVVDGHQPAKPKPDPEIYVLAAHRLGRAPEDCVVFEDSSAGVVAAKDAGARVVALRTTYASIPGADLTIDNFLGQELEPWLSRQTSAR